MTMRNDPLGVQVQPSLFDRPRDDAGVMPSPEPSPSIGLLPSDQHFLTVLYTASGFLLILGIGLFILLIALLVHWSASE
jgi:hypothetical protein